MSASIEAGAQGLIVREVWHFSPLTPTQSQFDQSRERVLRIEAKHIVNPAQADPIPLAPPHPTEPAATDPAAGLCNGRLRCSVAGRRALSAGAGSGHSEVVDLRLAHAPNAVEDEERCDRREYWLLQSAREILLATDCEVQWGADNPGPAETKVEGTRLFVKYEEFQSSDLCEIVEAVVGLAPPRLEKQQRWTGRVEHNRCIRGALTDSLPPAGDGSLGHPLLTLP